MQDEVCKVLCDVTVDSEQSIQFFERIEEDYTIHM